MRRVSSFGTRDEAVSPVISTILMVAVTVVLAATAFVLVADVGGNTATSAPPIGFKVDDPADRMTVTTAGQGADWSRLRLTLVSDGGSGTIHVGAGGAPPYINEPAGNTGGNLASSPALTAVAQRVTAGDFVALCRNGVTDGNVQVRFMDFNANAIVATYTFVGIAACPGP